MSQVSKKVLPNHVKEELFKNFWDLLASIKDPREIKIFIEDFLSPTEKIMLAKRIAISILLAKGYNHRSISRILKVSTTTVASIAKFLNLKTPGYQLLIKKYSQNESTREFIRELERYLYRLQPGQHFVEEGLIKAKLGHKKNVF